MSDEELETAALHSECGEILYDEKEGYGCSSCGLPPGTVSDTEVVELMRRRDALARINAVETRAFQKGQKAIQESILELLDDRIDDVEKDERNAYDTESMEALSLARHELETLRDEIREGENKE